MAHDVFISYSTKNKIIADAVCAKLEENKSGSGLLHVMFLLARILQIPLLPPLILVRYSSSFGPNTL